MDCCSGNKTSPEDEEEDLDGPMEDRSCTDIIFLVLFAAFLVGMVITISAEQKIKAIYLKCKELIYGPFFHFIHILYLV